MRQKQMLGRRSRGSPLSFPRHTIQAIATVNGTRWQQLVTNDGSHMNEQLRVQWAIPLGPVRKSPLLTGANGQVESPGNERKHPVVSRLVVGKDGGRRGLGGGDHLHGNERTNVCDGTGKHQDGAREGRRRYSNTNTKYCSWGPVILRCMSPGGQAHALLLVAFVGSSVAAVGMDLWVLGGWWRPVKEAWRPSFLLERGNGRVSEAAIHHESPQPKDTQNKTRPFQARPA